MHCHCAIKRVYCFTFILFVNCSSFHSISFSGESNSDQDKLIKELSSTIEAMVNAGGNHYRKKAILNQLEVFGLKDQTRQERIDWLSVQKNIIVDLPGKSDSLIYVVAHYDKTDINPLKLVSVFLNGLLDPLISWSYTSQGAIDNATGVAVTMQLAKSLKNLDHHYSYRMLFTGSEESGLRGSRAHVARLSNEEFEKIKYVINIDVVGVKGKQNCLYTLGVDDLEQKAILIAKQEKLDLGVEKMPLGVSSDYLPFKKTSFGLDFTRSFVFNLTGAFLPQRSYFTNKKSTKVINFSACDLLDFGDTVSDFTLMPVGSFHGFRDNIKKVDPKKLYEMYQLVFLILKENEKHKTPGTFATTPPPDTK